MKNKLSALISLLLCISILGACGEAEVVTCEDTSAPTKQGTDISDTEGGENELISAKDGLSFADNLMHMTAKDGNRTVSPYSAKMCLALLANGARGETKAQILNAVGISDLDGYNSSVKETLARYDLYKDVLALNTANAVWINKSTLGENAEILPPYKSALQNFYSAEAREVLHSNSVEEVNAWCDEKTNGKIKEIFTENNRGFALALTNAVYFKAAWETPFEKYLTKEAAFHNADGTITVLDFMNATDNFGYFEKDGVKAISLEYGRFGTSNEKDVYIKDKIYSFSMYFMLCDEELNIESFLNDNAPFVFDNVKLSIPKFELEYSLNLVDILKALGMTDAFDPISADLGGMVDLSKHNNLYVSDAKQKTYIKIDEEGTEAAAVTAIAVDECCAVIAENPKEFIADKPFYFAIRDNTSGEILFMGRYETAK